MRTVWTLAIAVMLAATAADAVEPYRAPRTASGAPDLEGLWSSASLTPLERLPAFKTVSAPEAEARAFEAEHNGQPSLPFKDDVGQGDSEWWDLGGKLGRIDGQARSAWLVDPDDGRLPLNETGRKAVAEHQAALLRDFEGPEARPSPERCLTAVSGTSAPPMMNASYNSNLQILQTKDHVVIVSEMNHDVRIVPLKDGRAAPGLGWQGHSAGRWEGNSLVVETTGFRPETAWRFPSRLYVSPQARVTERFTRVGPGELRYAFTVEDPATYTRTWRGEMPLTRTKGPMYEVACHEGNYALAGTLGGARQVEREAAGAK